MSTCVSCAITVSYSHDVLSSSLELLASSNGCSAEYYGDILRETPPWSQFYAGMHALDIIASARMRHAPYSTAGRRSICTAVPLPLPQVLLCRRHRARLSPCASQQQDDATAATGSAGADQQQESGPLAAMIADVLRHHNQQRKAGSVEVGLKALRTALGGVVQALGTRVD